MTAATLNGKIEMLPLYKKQEVSDFVDFLLLYPNNANSKDEYQQNPEGEFSSINSSVPKHPYAGCMKGVFGEMSDDFNEPLDDFKDYR